MDTSIKPRKAESTPSITRVRLVDYSEETPRVVFDHKLPMSPEKLDELDMFAARLLAGASMADWYGLPTNERIYVALAVNSAGMLSRMDMTFASAIDELGWIDASAMVARWRNRRA